MKVRLFLAMSIVVGYIFPTVSQAGSEDRRIWSLLSRVVFQRYKMSDENRSFPYRCDAQIKAGYYLATVAAEFPTEEKMKEETISQRNKLAGEWLQSCYGYVPTSDAVMDLYSSEEYAVAKAYFFEHSYKSYHCKDFRIDIEPETLTLIESEPLRHRQDGVERVVFVARKGEPDTRSPIKIITTHPEIAGYQLDGDEVTTTYVCVFVVRNGELEKLEVFEDDIWPAPDSPWECRPIT